MIVLSSYSKNYIPIKTIDGIAVECPLCKKKSSISMTFFQLQTETSASIQSTKVITATCHCNACENDIPNLRWSQELHDFFAIEKKKIVVKKSFKLKRGGKIALWILAAFPILFILLGLLGLILRYTVYR